ncbi:type IX secretion system protein PorQ [Lacibacter luteus]|uniref:Type IX secretion system protein PorQ n=2 Tax=Lacibacter luteus TaxID=2508719 RepID=A0A4V1M702_9BACT|nr:type IX secretion system protein PorQ [Lacibacter luteus]
MSTSNRTVFCLNYSIINAMRAAVCLIFLLCITAHLPAQTLGGQSAYNFLKFPASPQVSALGGINVSNESNDLSLAFSNPAQLDSAMHTQMVANFNALYAGVKNLHWMFAYRNQKLQTNFAAGILYFDYGATQQTDASGNVEGVYRPRDFVVQLMASREYLTRWKYGVALKFLASNYGPYRSSAIAADVAVLYKDTANLLQASVVAVNMGGQLKRYNPAEPEELPFDLQVGISKRLAKAPIRFSLTAHHLHRFNIMYNDTLFNNENGFENASAKKFTFDKLFQHFVFSTQLLIGGRVEVTAGFNVLRSQELKVSTGGNGLTGFSLGAGVLFSKLQLRYARTYFQNNVAYNQLGLTMPLNQYFGLGSWGEKAGW